ncbi:MAG TPA: pyridoxamine 5'-phosphate oxidase family protein [Acidimicrobiia bacterium]|nr:pyridoxamine 5'-phosphate oxidase family protein [Acidimicrobiia bacterium]
MSTWSDVTRSAPELAAAVRDRFEATGLGLLATVRADGSPRVSGLEPLFALDELWLGMMPDSRKALDLLRDPRFALHSATVDKKVVEGDAKVGGRAVPVDDHDTETFGRFVDAFEERTGERLPGGAFHLFRADVREMSFLKPAGDHLDIDWWTEGGGLRHVDRH